MERTNVMNWKSCRLFAAAAALVLTGFGVMFAGCSTPTTANGTGPDKAAASKSQARVSVQSGATLWGQNCGHCHNVRSPDSYSKTQWEVAMLHMRIRANLTAEEHKKILDFMKSAN